MKNFQPFYIKLLSLKATFALVLVLNFQAQVGAMQNGIDPTLEPHNPPTQTLTETNLESSAPSSNKPLFKNFRLSRFANIPIAKRIFSGTMTALGGAIAYGPLLGFATIGGILYYLPDDIDHLLIALENKRILSERNKDDLEIIGFVKSIAKKTDLKNCEKIIIVSDDYWGTYQKANNYHYLHIDTQEIKNALHLSPLNIERAEVEASAIHEITHMINNDSYNRILSAFAIPITVYTLHTALKKTILRGKTKPTGINYAKTELFKLLKGASLGIFNLGCFNTYARYQEQRADDGIKKPIHLRGIINSFNKELKKELKERKELEEEMETILKKSQIDPKKGQKAIEIGLKMFEIFETHPSLNDRIERQAKRLAEIEALEALKQSGTISNKEEPKEDDNNFWVPEDGLKEF